jgi:integrase
MLQLKNGCSCSEPSVYPKNWLTGGPALLKKTWYLQYKFYDPKYRDRYKYGRLIIIKGMNSYKTLPERRAAVSLLFENELDALKNYQYNPITGTRVDSIDEVRSEYEIDPSTPFIQALEDILKRLTVEDETRRDIKSVVKYTGMAAARLRYDKIEIADVRRKHIKIILDEVGRIPLIDAKGKRTERKWTPNRYNVYWKYLHRLFEELIELEACEYNPVSKISKKSIVHKMRLTMTKEQRHETINVYLKEHFYTFYRFCQIFFHSGGRMTELMKIQVKDIDLGRQRYKITIKKGKNQHEEERTIKDKSLPFWEELIGGAKPDDYIFAKGLKPGPNSISSHQITRRWRKNVKEKLGITADIYSLKHSNLDETAALLDIKAAQNQAGHTTPVITIGRYLHGEKERQHQRLKGVDNEL